MAVAGRFAFLLPCAVIITGAASGMAKKNTAEAKDTGKEKLGRKGKATREMLDRAILELVNERGFTNFRLQDLCDRTGLTIGAFYFHYKNKDQALESVAAGAAAKLFSVIESDIEAKPLREEFRLAIRDYQRSYSDPQLREQARMMRSMIPANQTVTRAYFKSRSSTIGKLVDKAVEERRAEGLKSGPERAVIEYLFSGLADFFELLYLGEDADLKRSAGSDKKVVERLTEIWYQAVMSA